MTEEEYRSLPNSEYFSSSFLKMFDKEGPSSLLKEIEYKNSGLFKGSIVDCLAFNNNNFEDIYYVSDVIKEPTSSELKLLQNLEEEITKKEIGKEYYINTGLKIIKKLDLWKNIKNDEILIKKLLSDNFKKHLISYIESKNKIVISGNDYINSLETVNNLKNNEFTKEYFINKNIKDKQVLFQIPILFEIEDNKFKSLLDIILIDHKNKEIRAVDLKTGHHDNEAFKWSILKYRYDIQGGLYTKALESYIIKNGLIDYKIKNPIFIYTQVSKPDRPFSFELDRNIVEGSFTGFTTLNGYKYKGILELVSDIIWHRENNIYNYTREQYTNKKLLIESGNLNISDYNSKIPKNFFNNYKSLNIEFHQGLQIENLYDRAREQIQQEFIRHTFASPPRRTGTLNTNENQIIRDDNTF